MEVAVKERKSIRVSSLKLAEAFRSQLKTYKGCEDAKDTSDMTFEQKVMHIKGFATDDTKGKRLEMLAELVASYRVREIEDVKKELFKLALGR